MAEEITKETLGEVVAEIRDLLEALSAIRDVIAKPKATDWEYGILTATDLTEMKDIVVAKPGTGNKLNPTCAIARVEKASLIDVCLTPLTAQKSEIIAPGSAPDNGLFIHWFPWGIYTVGTSEGENKFWVRAQGITETGKAEAVILYEEVMPPWE